MKRDSLLKATKVWLMVNGGASLDTFDIEPLPAEHPLRKLNNVTLTPHIAGASIRTVYYAAEVMAQDLKNFIDGNSLNNQIC